MKILPVGAELFHADLTKLIVASRNFANAPKNRILLWQLYLSHKYIVWQNEEICNVTAGFIQYNHVALKG
jgi:hypothetical protein